MNIPMIFSLLGRLLAVYAAFMCFPLSLALALGEECKAAFFFAALITGLPGLLLWHKGKDADIKFSLREVLVVVGGFWIITALFGALPYYLAHIVPTYIDALFESVSGITTTGATVLTNIEVLPYSILFWRSLTNWLGGISTLVLFLVLLPKSGLGSVLHYNAEIPGSSADRFMPKHRDSVIALFLVYLVISIGCTLLLWGAGMSFFDALNHAMATVSTGGFSTKNANIMYFNSITIELIITFFMILAGTNLALVLLAWQRKNLKPLQNTELLIYLLLIFVAAVISSLNLFFIKGEPLLLALRHGLFQVASFASTTGFVFTDYALWPSLGSLILLLLMFVGGCAGSTAGGIKVSRLIMLGKTAWTELRKGIHPKAVSSIKLDDKLLDEDSLNRVGIFFFIYIVVFAAGSILMTGFGLEPFEAMRAVAAALGNVGSGFSSVGPGNILASISLLGKLVLAICMLFGRLEFFSLLLLLHPDFWQRRKVW